MKNTTHFTRAFVFVLACCFNLLKAQPSVGYLAGNDLVEAGQQQVEKHALRNLAFQMLDLEMAQSGLEKLYMERTAFQQSAWLSQEGFAVLECVQPWRVPKDGQLDAMAVMEELYFGMLDLEAEVMELQEEVGELSAYDQLAGEGRESMELQWWVSEGKGSLVAVCHAGLAMAEDLDGREMWRELLEMAEDLVEMEQRLEVMRARIDGRKGWVGNS